MKTVVRLLAMNFLLLLVSACGGGGGAAPAVTTKVVVKVTLSGTPLPSGTSVAGAAFTISLPAGTTVSTDANGAVVSGTVEPSGVFAGGAQLPPQYTAASGSTAGSLLVTVVSGSAGGSSQLGEIATVSFQQAGGVAPASSAFVFSGVSVIDTGGNPIAGVTATVTSVTLQ